MFVNLFKLGDWKEDTVDDQHLTLLLAEKQAMRRHLNFLF